MTRNASSDRQAAAPDLPTPQTASALRLPNVQPGERIGLFGGSFNPPHEGHLHVSELALQKAGLDRIWWIVTPGNPLKDHSELAPLGERIEACRKIAKHPRIVVTAFEASYRIRYTADTLALVKRLRPRANFVWLMGADNLAGFHKWQNWRKIASLMPFVVIDRPGATLSYRSARAAIALSKFRIDEDDVSLISGMKPPAWAFVRGPRSGLSSTAIRQRLKGE